MPVELQYHNSTIIAICTTSFCNHYTHACTHRECTGMSKVAYDLLTAEDSAEWVCDSCVNSKAIPTVKMVIKS